MTQDTEIWKPVDGHLDYEVSNHGRVRSLDHQVAQGNRWGTTSVRFFAGKVLNPHLREGYPTVNLNGRIFSVHRLVALAFVPGHSDDLIVNHDDGDKTNNYYKNLEWTTHSGNSRHAVDNFLIDTYANVKGVWVGDKFYNSQTVAAKVVGCSIASMSRHLASGKPINGYEVRRG